MFSELLVYIQHYIGGIAKVIKELVGTLLIIPGIVIGQGSNERASVSHSIIKFGSNRSLARYSCGNESCEFWSIYDDDKNEAADYTSLFSLARLQPVYYECVEPSIIKAESPSDSNGNQIPSEACKKVSLY